ncbi:RNA-guided endonuclease InsQ/TnpB family protein [Desulfuribacillus alkaliarsenatis]|uniref:Transposase n=1 Tax=Desulfuribacillus alkaliarsenatis TaxID=766136 RepID=A0A1E5FZM8_9FIRM|nr:RNA-guided endonuclease TnpB family protein [Desulfuribacillus alkaliarsenatis]OEF96045.1 transposase [Desulfuribacillus alkaliarsenatis]
MKLSLKYYPRWKKEQLQIIEELSFHTTKLYNIANHQCREKYKSYRVLEKELKQNWHKPYLHSHTYQQLLKVLEQNWKSYFSSLKDYKQNPSKYKAMPQPPKYKHIHKRKNEIIFTNLAIRRKDGHILLSLSKTMQKAFKVDSLKVEEPKTLPLPEHAHIQQIRLQYDQNWHLLIIYNIPAKAQSTSKNIMAIDLGLSNLSAITFSHSKDNYIIDGKSLKSINGYINKKIAHLQSIRMKQTSAKAYKTTKQIKRLRKKRHDYITNYLHQASRTIINLAQQYDIGTIVIGDIKRIKQHSTLKTFVQIPIERFTKMIQYKAELAGIKITYQKETYTSGVSAIDLEPITKTYYNKTRRVCRGLFRTNQGIYVNADINGSLNILRKTYTGTPNLITSVRDNGCVNHPQRIRVA